MLFSTETEKKLTLDLRKEVSGDFSRALLLLAEVCHPQCGETGAQTLKKKIKLVIWRDDKVKIWIK